MRLSSLTYLFGQHNIHSSQVFFESALSIGFVNIKPIVPGHVLVIPKRVERRVMGLTIDEYTDLFASVRFIAPRLEKHYKAQALNIAIQDGVESGQSVPHVHVHVLPRKAGDFQRNDDVYDALENQALDQVFRSSERVARSVAEMNYESATLRTIMNT